MSLYNMMFGENPVAGIILAALGLSKDDCGRFRNVFVTDEGIAIYTRNGGGNRNCWHESDPEWGQNGCKHEEIKKVVPETREVKNGPLVSLELTGKEVEETRYICLAPDSIECACPGCIAQYRLPAHPLYLRDEDDDFDCTYATFYFKFPPEYEESLRKLSIGEFDPTERWKELFKNLEGGDPTTVAKSKQMAEALKTLFESAKDKK